MGAQPIVALLDNLNEFDFETGATTMATQAIQQPQLNVMSIPRKAPALAKIVPIKAACYGEQGSGKTTTAALLLAALSKEYHNSADIWVTDPENGWQFPKARIFATEKIKLVQRSVPTFAAMRKDLKDAEKAGACGYAVEVGKIWKELLKTCQARCGSRWGQELSKMWNEFIYEFLNSPLQCIVLGRVGDVTEELLDEKSGEISKIKVGEKLNAGGSNNFGYEPHLVIRLSTEQKPRVKTQNGVRQELEGEGRIVHRAHIVKDRTWELNGRIFRWADKQRYVPGGYSVVWGDLKPHFDFLQKTENPELDTAASSDHLVNDNGNSEWYAHQQKKDVLRGELHATMEYLFGGQSADAKKMRLEIFGMVFDGWKSKEAADAMPLDKIERGVRILQAFEKRCKGDESILKSSPENILNTLDIDIKQYDQGVAEEQEFPF